MKILISEEVETVGWNTVMASAPRSIADCLKAGSQEGRPVVAGKTSLTGWAVVEYVNNVPTVILRDSDPAAATT
jgi:hypothetical protein